MLLPLEGGGGGDDNRDGDGGGGGDDGDAILFAPHLLRFPLVSPILSHIPSSLQVIQDPDDEHANVAGTPPLPPYLSPPLTRPPHISPRTNYHPLYSHHHHPVSSYNHHHHYAPPHTTFTRTSPPPPLTHTLTPPPLTHTFTQARVARILS